MSFVSFTFLFYFFPLFFILYIVVPSRFRRYAVIIGSYFFYSWGTPVGAMLLLFSSVFDHLIVRKLHAAGGTARKAYTAAGVALNLGVLGYFKYFNFFMHETNRLLSLISLPPLPATADVIMLLGVSFFTFQKITYIVDVYRGDIERPASFVSYCAYVAFFPKLIQGPISRYRDMADDMPSPSVSLDSTYRGVMRFIVGLGKKVLLADPLANIANAVFALKSADLSTEYAWLGMAAYTFQIYLDFSGYTDMAIGLAEMLGFRLPENFNRPYVARTVTEFWKRWHMSLTAWFREYLYFPLGGNKKSAYRTYVNLWIVFLTSGLWHGANWTFIVWGGYHGLFLVLDRIFWKEASKRWGAAITVSLTFLIVSIGWVFFRSDSITQALNMIAALFDPTRIGETGIPIGYVMKNRELAAFLIAAFLSFFPEQLRIRMAGLAREKANALFLEYAAAAGACAVFFLSIISLANNSFKPFLYLRF